MRVCVCVRNAVTAATSRRGRDLGCVCLVKLSARKRDELHVKRATC